MRIEEIKEEIDKVKSSKELELLRVKYLGKKGLINNFLKEIRNLSPEKRRERGIEVNNFKKSIELLLKEKEKNLKTKKIEREGEIFDVSLPGKKFLIGNIHPISQVIRRSKEIFEKTGFSVVEGPELESEWYNFDALNFPQNHPAREMQDTLWTKEKGKLMRTHTSAVQVRYMEKNRPPYRIIVPGRTFRNEATDASHEIQFYQLEGLMIDKEVSVVDFKAIIKIFFRELFEKEINVRLRPGFFPFTEPSFEVDIKYNNKWLECAGAGMVHPNVLKNSGVNPKEWQGFAFGFGVDRIAMIKYGIDDIRLFYSSDLRFLKQF